MALDLHGDWRKKNSLGQKKLSNPLSPVQAALIKQIDENVSKQSAYRLCMFAKNQGSLNISTSSNIFR
jgi:hypothetical protein